MGRGVQEAEGAHRRDQRSAGADTEKARDREAPQERETLILAFHKTLARFFPGFKDKLGLLSDPRDPAKITYTLATLFFAGIFTFMFKLGSRRQMDFLFNSPEFVGNLGACSGQKLIRTPHNDTLAYLCRRISPGELHRLRVDMVRSLIRSRALDGARLFKKWWIIAVDGTGLVTYTQRHCPRCLTMTRDGKTLWYHNVLEAKLITPDGLALSIGTEFIENEGPEVSRQDCELSAFFRLATRLKADFPQLPICLGGDSLYACATVFEVAREHGWRFIFTFKRGSIPTVFEEFEKLKDRCVENTARREDDEIVQQFSWVCDLEHAGHRLAVMECVEAKKKTGEMTRFVWITNMEVKESNYRSIAKGGRLRWTIENQGFNTQKNGGYGLEHVFCSDNEGAKNFYLLLQIAHMINQLIEKGSLLRAHLKTFGSIRNLARFLLEAFRTCVVSHDSLEAELALGYQIRLDSS